MIGKIRTYLQIQLLRSTNGSLISITVELVTQSNDLLQVTLVDEFVHPKRGTTSHCYRIVYRHMDKVFTQEEVNVIHRAIEHAATERLGVEIR